MATIYLSSTYKDLKDHRRVVYEALRLEYRRAEYLKKPCLTLVVHDMTAWPRLFDDAHTGDNKGERIKALRQHLRLGSWPASSARYQLWCHDVAIQQMTW